MTFNCKRYYIVSIIIFTLLILGQLVGYPGPINIIDVKYAMFSTIIAIVAIAYACNNYKLEITDEQITLYHLIGKNKCIKLREINKIEIENLSFMEKKPIGIYGTKHVRLFVYTDAKIYELKLRALDTRLISEYLEKMAPIWGVPFKNKMEDIL